MLSGRIKVKITVNGTSGNIERLINEIGRCGTVCRGICLSDGVIYATLERKGVEIVRDVSEQYGGEMTIIEKCGGIFKALRYRKRYGILAGLLLFFLIIGFFSNTVMVIEVYGGEKISHSEMLEILSRYDIEKGSFIPSLDFKYAAKEITFTVEGISWISIRNTGGRVMVEYTETDPSPKLTPQHIPSNIVASRPAQIVDVEVYMGELQVMLRDGVRKGEILVSGVLQDKQGASRYVHSLGRIIGRYTDNVTVFQPFSEQKLLMSGEEIVKKSLCVFGLRMPLSLGSVEGLYDYSERSEPLYLFDRRLPIEIIYETYRPFEETTLSFTAEEARAEAEQKIAEYEKNILKNVSVKGKTITEIPAEDGIKLLVTYTLEGEIGEQSCIFAE